METRRELKAEARDAELRAGRFFEKLMKIENILKRADESKEMYYQTVDKIKEVIAQN